MRCGKTDLGAELFKARTSALYKSAAIIRRLLLARAVFGKSDYSPTISPQHQLQHRPNRLALPIRNYANGLSVALRRTLMHLTRMMPLPWLRTSRKTGF